MEAKTIYEGARDAFGAHRRTCYGCHVAQRDTSPMKFCDIGWELAKAATRSWHRLERARGKTAVRDRGEQLSMF